MAWTPHKEGDAITLAAVNDNIDALEAQANTAEVGAITPKSLHAEHLPSVIGDAAAKDIHTDLQTYTNVYPGWGVDTIGAPGWQVIANSTHGNLEVSFTGVDTTKHKLLVMANIYVRNITHHIDGNAGYTRAQAAVKIQVKDGSGGWVGINRTERYRRAIATKGGTTTTETQHGDIPIRTLITSDDVTGAIYGVRAVVSLLHYGGDTTAGTGKVSIKQCTLSAITIKQAI